MCRCAIAVGDVQKARYLHVLNKKQKQAAEDLHSDGSNHYEVQARIALLNKQFKRAEAIYLEQVWTCFSL